jgi:hypothetical protein
MFINSALKISFFFICIFTNKAGRVPTIHYETMKNLEKAKVI